MLKNWIKAEVRQPCPYTKFSLTEFTEIRAIDPTEKDEQNIAYMGQLLVRYHGNPEMIADDLRMLADDAASIGLTIVKNYVEAHVLPSKGRISTRIGNWGEIIASQCMTEFDGYSFPIYKLRFREKRSWAMRLTDLFFVKDIASDNPTVCYGEVKTHSGENYNTSIKRVAIEAHESLRKDDALGEPEILNFIRNLLYTSNRFEEARFFGLIQHKRITYNLVHILFLVHNSTIWRDEILEELQNHTLDVRLRNLGVYVLRVSNLRRVIDASYDNAWKAIEV